MGEIGRLPALELAQWAEFEGEFGPLTLQERIDAAAAHVAAWGYTGSDKPDFRMRWRRAPRWTPDRVWDWLGAMAKGS